MTSRADGGVKHLLAHEIHSREATNDVVMSMLQQYVQVCSIVCVDR